MELLLAIISYLILGVAYLRGISSVVLLCGMRGEDRAFLHKNRYSFLRLLTITFMDILFLRRLFVINKVLWIGEWIFHMSFILSILGHLRFILNPAPLWFWHLSCIGKYAGLILPFSLIYILVVRIALNKSGDYISRSNLFLILLILGIGITGAIMGFIVRQDIIDIKYFIVGIFSFSPNPIPESPLFLIHYILFLILLVYLPSHIIAAPFVMMDARKREETFSPLGNEE